MWAHYCDSHKGGVIGIRCIQDLDTVLLAGKPVVYQEDLPALEGLDSWIRRATATKPVQVFNKHVLVKSTAWAYELEWRTMVWSDESDPYMYSTLDPRELSSIYLGCRMTDDDRAEILDLIRNHFPASNVYSAAKSSRRFGIDFNPEDLSSD